MTKSNKIFLVGFMGCGKSTLGKKLAKKLNTHFFDLDKEIEKQEGRSISDIFDTDGENFFRAKENEILNEIMLNNDCFVMSVGGGTPCFHNNIELINNSGTSIYLRYNSGILTSRLINSKNERPLIKNLNKEELKVFIENKLKEREYYYKQSHFIAEGNNIKVEDLEELI